MKVRELFEVKVDQFTGEIDYIGDANDRIEQWNNGNPRNDKTYLDVSSLRLKRIPRQVRDMKHESFHAYDNRLSTFENFPKIAGYYDLSDNNFKSLNGIERYIHAASGLGVINLEGNPVTSHVLGLLKIKRLSEVMFIDSKSKSKAKNPTKMRKLQDIINNYLPNTRGNDAIMDCQNDLIDAGFDEYAQL